MQATVEMENPLSSGDGENPPPLVPPSSDDEKTKNVGKRNVHEKDDDGGEDTPKLETDLTTIKPKTDKRGNKSKPKVLK